MAVTGTTTPGGVETGPPIEADGADGRRWTVTPLVGGQWRAACRGDALDGPLVACRLTDAMVRALLVLADGRAVSSTVTRQRHAKPSIVADRSAKTLVGHGLAQSRFLLGRPAYEATDLGRELAAVIDGATA